MARGEMATMQAERTDEGGGAPHVPVLARAVAEILGGARVERAAGWIVDATLGAGGHAAFLLESLRSARVLGVDQDPEALAIAGGRLLPFGDRARLRRGRFSALAKIVREEGIAPVVGVLFDLGASSMQLDSTARGFSFRADSPLDMRMDPSRDRNAADVVNGWDERDLADLFFHEGGEPRARAVARAIVEARRRAPFLRTGALADLVARTVGRGAEGSRIHPATRTFQALRRAVNEEGEELLLGLAAAERILVPGGRLVAISFHSGEDREVKRFLARGSREGRFQVLTRKPIGPDEVERRANVRSRSARLRAAERLDRDGGVP